MPPSFEQRGRSPSASSTASSKKSGSSPFESRSNSHARYLEKAEEPQRNTSISFTSEEKSGDSPRKPQEIETPNGPIKRPETLEALGTLSQQSWRQDAVVDEPNWPREWRAYACLLGGFLLMFNSWYVHVSDYIRHIHHDADFTSTGDWSIPMAPTLPSTCSTYYLVRTCYFSTSLDRHNLGLFWFCRPSLDAFSTQDTFGHS